jgi:hypothetical protein
MNETITLPIEGTAEKTTVPDTLDLAERARLAVHGIMGSIDPDLLTMYGLIFYATPWPHQSHWASAENTCDPKFGESLPLLRTMCGSEEGLDLQERYLAAMLNRVQDGLYWDLVNPKRPWRNSYSDASFYGEGKNEDFAVLASGGRMIRALMAWRAVTGSDRFDAKIRELVHGMARVAVRQDDYAYYPEKGGWGEPCAYPRSGWLNTEEAQSETDGGEGSITGYHGHQIYGAMQWYAASGDATALDLAAQLSRYVMKSKFWGGVPGPFDPKAHVGHIGIYLPDPPYTAGAELGHWFSHFHARAIPLRGLLEFGRTAGDDRVLEFVRRSYEFTLTQGIARLGWVNCWPRSRDHDNLCEACALGDLVAMGIRLSDAGLGDYWDDVDACVRNQLVEQQVTDAAALERIAAASSNPSWQETGPAFPNKLNYDNTIARTLGVFFGQGSPGAAPNPWVMHCCTGNASQGLYYAWEGAVRENGDTAQVNLLLNRAAKLLDVHSFLPYEGKVILKNKGARRIAVRIPAWVDRRALRATVGGQPVDLDWLGNRLLFCGLDAPCEITLTFPVVETTARYTVGANTPGEHAYTCTFRGSTCVDVSPKDTAPTSYPFYDRAHLRTSRTPMKKVERFIADRIVGSW